MTYWQHRKGGLYEVLHHAVNEADLRPVVVYRSLKDNKIWVRPMGEFYDGRFTRYDK